MPESAAKQARRYFARIEACFDVNHVPYSDASVPAPSRDAWIRALLELMLVLSERLRRRAFCTSSAPPALTSNQRATARATANVLSALTRESFPARAGGACDWRSFRDAMERYANGELRYVYAVSHANGARGEYIACEPDSSFHALWAEFALLALELEAEPAFFRSALPTYVATMQLYGDVYAGGAEPTPLGSRGRFDPAQRASAVAKRCMRAEFEALAFDDLVARHVALARLYCSP
jgi:hypothetical protein